MAGQGDFDLTRLERMERRLHVMLAPEELLFGSVPGRTVAALGVFIVDTTIAYVGHADWREPRRRRQVVHGLPGERLPALRDEQPGQPISAGGTV
jgi:hypothetical protein